MNAKTVALVFAMVTLACRKTSVPMEVCPAAVDAGAIDLGADACKGPRIDLERALRNPKCHAPFELRAPRHVYERALKVIVTPSATKIAGCGRVDVDVTFKNEDTQELPLVFSGEPSGIGLAIEDASHHALGAPEGSCQAPQTIAEHVPYYAMITLDAGGEARARLPWEAVARRYGKPKQNDPMGGCEIVRAGPVPKGTYTLTVMTALWTQHPSNRPDWAESFPQTRPTVSLTVE